MNNSFSKLALVIALAAGPTGCDSFDPEVGLVQAGACDPADSDPETDISFSRDILPVVIRADEDAGCSCHLPTSSFRIGVDLGGLDLSSYATLRDGGKNAGSDIIVPGDPCKSVLVQKASSAPPFGSRMPLYGPPYLSDGERQAIHDWIAEGAQNN